MVEKSIPERYLRIKIFLGSTTEKVEEDLLTFLIREKLCVGNYVDLKLYKLGGVYQLVFVYAQVIGG